jgi:hypothetical protein
MALTWANNPGQSLLWAGRVLINLVLSSLMESIVVRDRLLLRWDCRDMRLGMARVVRARVQSNLCASAARMEFGVLIQHLVHDLGSHGP